MDLSFIFDQPEIVIAALLFLATFVSEDAACIAAGSAAASGRIGLATAVAACMLGIFAGDMLLYAIGRSAGPRILASGIVRRFATESRIAKAATWLAANGASAVFLSRFVVGLRLPTYVAAGALRLDIRRFGFYFFVAAAIWTPVLVISAAWSQSFIFGGNALVGAVVLIIALRLILRLGSRRGRRLAVGRVRRIIEWEFWPLWLFYIPVVIHVIRLGIRHRSLTAFAAANPGFPAGGFKGESKSAIYEAIAASEPGLPFMLRYVRLDADACTVARIAAARRFLAEAGISLPVAVKPDQGERGSGVRIAHTEAELDAAITKENGALIVQEFAGGIEAGVFYYRRPSEPEGHIFSMTEKNFPVVVGDGVSSVEELILADRRAVCLADKYFEQLGDRIEQVPEAGESVTLIDIGTHSRGAVFLDGERLRTAELERSLDAICRRIDGFYFGRFDLRADSFEDMMAGRFRIIELNGVTSESTNIYDPMYSLRDAYGILFRQWELAFEIGAENIGRGTPRTGVHELLRLAFGKTRMNPADRCPPTPATETL